MTNTVTLIDSSPKADIPQSSQSEVKTSMILIRLAIVFWIQREKSTRKINLSLAMLIKLVVASDKNGQKF